MSKKPTRKQLDHALAIVSGRVIAPGLDYCRVLGFDESDWRVLSVGGQVQPPHIDTIKIRCEEIISNAIINGVFDVSGGEHDKRTG